MGLDAQLQAVLSSPSGATAYNSLVQSTVTAYTPIVQTDLNDASPTILSALLSDPVAMTRLYDFSKSLSGIMSLFGIAFAA